MSDGARFFEEVWLTQFPVNAASWMTDRLYLCWLTVGRKEFQRNSEVTRSLPSSPKRLAVVPPKPQSPGESLPLLCRAANSKPTLPSDGRIRPQMLASSLVIEGLMLRDGRIDSAWRHLDLWMRDAINDASQFLWSTRRHAHLTTLRTTWRAWWNVSQIRFISHVYLRKICRENMCKDESLTKN